MMKEIICPVSSEKVNENVVRMTALLVVVLLGLFLLLQSPIIPVFLAVDFYIRAFTKMKSSPLSWFAKHLVRFSSLGVIPIDKAPKIFAARIGFVFSVMIVVFTMLSFPVFSLIISSVLVLFAFLECGLNFCAGCWVYSYLVLPVYKNK